MMHLLKNYSTPLKRNITIAIGIQQVSTRTEQLCCKKSRTAQIRVHACQPLLLFSLRPLLKVMVSFFVLFFKLYITDKFKVNSLSFIFIKNNFIINIKNSIKDTDTFPTAPKMYRTFDFHLI